MHPQSKADQPPGRAEPSDEAGAAPPRKVNAIDGWRYFALAPGFILVRLLAASLRFELTPASRPNVDPEAPPMVIVLWHNRLFVAAELHRRYRRKAGGRQVYGLISASRDGAWLAAFFRLMRVGTVRGSSSFRGTTATRALLRRLHEGHDICLTPDGPRGPRYRVAQGVISLARLSKAPLTLVHVDFQRAWRLRSWDGFYVPLPFSKVRLDVERLQSWRDLAEPGEDPRQLDRELLTRRLGARMRARTRD